MQDCPPNRPLRDWLVDRLLGGLALRSRIDDLPEAERLYGARALRPPSSRDSRARFGPRIRRRDRGVPASNRIQRGSLGVPRGAEAEARIRGPDSRLPFDANAKRSTPSPSASARDRKLGSDSSTGDQPVLRHRASSQRANPAKPERTSRGSELGPGQLKTLRSKGAAAQTRDRGNRHREKDHSSHRTLLNRGLGLAGHHDRLGETYHRPNRRRSEHRRNLGVPRARSPRSPARGGEPGEPTHGGRSDEGGTRSCRPREKPPAGLAPSEARSGGPGGASPRPRRRTP